VGIRITAAAAIFAIGAIAIYDATVVLPSCPSSGGKDDSVNEHVVRAVLDTALPDTAADTEDAADGANEADGESFVDDGGGDSGGVIERSDPLQYSAGNWRNPFAAEGFRTPPRLLAINDTTPAAIPAGDPFAGYQPNVQAVMITATHRSVILDRLVLSEGDAVPGTGSTVHKVLPHGVELEKNEVTKFYPMD